jgi:hypothetical protein
MTSSRSALLIATGLALALLVPSAAQAQNGTDLPVGESRGVHLVNQRGGLVLIFSQPAGKLRKRVNSRYAWIECTELGEPFSGSHSGNLNVRRRGRRVRTGFGAGDADFCRFFLRAHKVKRRGASKRVPRRDLFAIPLTQAGAVYLDEESKTRQMLRLALVASVLKEDRKLSGQPTYGQLIEAYPRLAKVVVELSPPSETPPPKRVGYYSDGGEHLVLAILSASGKRLFIETSAGDVLSTNVARHLFDDPF